MVQSPREKLSRTSMSLAVLAAFSIFVMPAVLPYIFGSLAIVFAILSKGGREIFPRRSRTAVTVAAAALMVNTALLTVSILYFVKAMHDPVLQEQFDQILFQRYGITFEELLNQLGLQNGIVRLFSIRMR